MRNVFIQHGKFHDSGIKKEDVPIFLTNHKNIPRHIFLKNQNNFFWISFSRASYQGLNFLWILERFALFSFKFFTEFLTKNSLILLNDKQFANNSTVDFIFKDNKWSLLFWFFCLKILPFFANFILRLSKTQHLFLIF